MSLQASVIGYPGRIAPARGFARCRPSRGWGPAGRGAHTNQGATVVTKERFEQGLTLHQYVDHMSVNRERFVDALDEVTLGPGDAHILERLGKTRRVLVISEDWCGTCLAHVPFVAKLVEGHPNIEMRLLPHDANLDLMDQYLQQLR